MKKLLMATGIIILVLACWTALQSFGAALLLAAVGSGFIFAAKRVNQTGSYSVGSDIARTGHKAGMVAADMVGITQAAIQASGVRELGKGALQTASSAASAFAAGYAGHQPTQYSPRTPDGPEMGIQGRLLEGGTQPVEVDRASQDSISVERPLPAFTDRHKTLLIDIILCGLAIFLVIGIGSITARSVGGHFQTTSFFAVVIALFLDITIVPVFIVCCFARRWSHAAIIWPIAGVGAIVVHGFLGYPSWSLQPLFMATGLQVLICFCTIKLFRKIFR